MFFILAGQVGNSAFAKKPPKPEFPYHSTLTHKSPENNLPIYATKRILKERENFLGLTYCNYPIEKNSISLTKSSIKSTTHGNSTMIPSFGLLLCSTPCLSSISKQS